MNSIRAFLGFRVGLVAATALLTLVGASLNASGHAGWSTARAGFAGLGALAAGVVYRNWGVAVPAGGAALVFTLLIAQFNPKQGDLLLQVVGLAMLGAAGAIGGVPSRNFVETVPRQSTQPPPKNRPFPSPAPPLPSAPPPLPPPPT